MSDTRLKLTKIKQMLSNTPRLHFCYLKIIHILHPRYHPKVIGHILKNKQKIKYDCVHEIMRLIILKNRSQRHDINKPRSRYGHKYSKYKKCLTMMTLIYIKQHLSNIWSSILLIKICVIHVGTSALFGAKISRNEKSYQ